MRKCESRTCLLACIFNLNCSEAEVYSALLGKSSADVEEIAKAVGKDRTTVYRALQSLMNRGLVRRECRILRGGGYKYLYRPMDDLKELVKERMNVLIDEILKHEEGTRHNLGEPRRI